MRCISSGTIYQRQEFLAGTLTFSFDIVIEGYRFLVSFIITNLFLAISQLTRKIKNFQQNTISAKVYYIELIIIPIIVIFSLYFFDSVFDNLARNGTI